MTSRVHHPQVFVCKENDTSSLFSHLHTHKAQQAYQEIKRTTTAEVLNKWPLLAELHADDQTADNPGNQKI